MGGVLKDDLTVALDDVDRTASQIVTIYDDLATMAADPAVSEHLRHRAERQRQTLTAFNRARSSAGQTPEVGDPERAHLQSLWLTLKSLVAGEHSEEQLQESSAELESRLRDAVRAALDLGPEPVVRDALQRLVSEPAPSAPGH